MVEKEKSRLEKVREEIGNEGAYWNEVRGNIDYVKGISFCTDVIDKYLKEESEQEPCRKAIDYDAVMQILYDFDCANENALMVKAIKELPSVKLVFCDDAISRQAVIDKKELVELEDGQSFYCISPEVVETLPPITSQSEIIRCSQCKYAEVADSEDSQDGYTCQFHRGSIWFSGSYCSWAERSDKE